MRHEFDFAYESLIAGYFLASHRPSASGRYRYMPYRAGGHYKLHCALQAGEQPRCTFSAHPNVSFIVLACPEYGVLELSDFIIGDVA
ncbi:MAG TPA: hypothetical protein VFG04_01370 [Planctomycetaceae bacterium]|jgi:hypothetical protein|nr:hypothetical protein [Planctomycetaceae bacterium]